MTSPTPHGELPDTIAAFNAAVRQSLLDAIHALGGHEVTAESLSLSPVPNPEMGDVALPCFPLRGRLAALDEKARNNPAAIAHAVAEHVADSAVIAGVRSAGPYVNVTFDTSALAHGVLHEVLTHGAEFGGSQAAPSERVVIEFSAPNTNKPQHLGHVRNNVLGESTARILAHHGHDVIKVNLVNDRGIHICKSMLAYQLWGDGATPSTAGKKGDHLIGDFYVLFETRFRDEYATWLESEEAEARYQSWLSTPDGARAEQAWAAAQAALAASEAEQDDRTEKEKKKKKKARRRARPPRDVFEGGFRDAYFNEVSPLGTQARDMLLAWEGSVPEVRALWSTLDAWVMAGFDETYRRLGVSFDHVYRESETFRRGKSEVERGLASSVFSKRDDGAVVFDLEQAGLSGAKVMLRADGTSVYITQDLGTALARYEELGFERMMYVVADEQAYHFRVLFAALAKLVPELEGRLEHLAYGLVHLPHGRMKSREGTVVDADELIDEMMRLARVKIDEELGGEHYSALQEDEIVHRAEHIGLAALKYYLLDVTPGSTMEFDPARSIDLHGRTGAYCLYNYARTRSLLRKAGGAAPDWDASCVSRLTSPEERKVLKELLRFPDTLRWAAETRDASKIAEHLFDLCKCFAFIFTDRKGHPIVTCDDQELRQARLILVVAVGTVLRLGLSLLGIDTLEEM